MEGSGKKRTDADVRTLQVTCGSVLKLEHKATKYRLHSEDVTYGTGSGQHSVTGTPQATEGASYWIVRGPLGTPCDQGTPLENGAIIRLQHSQSKRWLHSHLFRSPLSGQQEVSSFGGADESDTGDNWKLEVIGKGPWKQNQEIQLQHVDTKAYLMSHTKKFGQPIAGQLEVCATQGRPNANTKWMAAEGVYFSPREGTCS